MTSAHTSHAADPHSDLFVTTQWTVVLDAGRKSSPQSDRAPEELCRVYWYPLYAYVRRRGHPGIENIGSNPTEVQIITVNQ